MSSTSPPRATHPSSSIKLRYEILPDGTAAIGRPEFQPAESVTASLELQGAGQTTFICPPVRLIEYHWEATDADGDEAEHRDAELLLQRHRFNWTPIELKGVTIYYYSGSDKDAQEMSAGGHGDYCIDVRAARRDDGFSGQGLDLQEHRRHAARPPAPQRDVRSSVITAGVRVATDTVLVLGNGVVHTLRHELTHVVTAVAGESPSARCPPGWMKAPPSSVRRTRRVSRDAVDAAIDRGNVFSVRQITSYPGDPTKSSTLLRPVLEPRQVPQRDIWPREVRPALRRNQSGKRIDGALEAVYGFDQDGLDNEWRAAHGS